MKGAVNTMMAEALGERPQQPALGKNPRSAANRRSSDVNRSRRRDNTGAAVHRWTRTWRVKGGGDAELITALLD